MSSAELESNALCVASMAAAYICQAYCDLFLNNASLPITVPIFIDSQAAEAINANDKTTTRIKHIERRALLHCHHCQCCLIFPYHINGDLYNLADIGTESIAKGAAYKSPSLI
jgi:succinate dehydrogenase/fumarate reductase-like Fe-S protein